MSTQLMDPVFASALRDRLAAVVQETPRLRRRWRWRLGTGVLAGSVALAGGVAVAAGLFSQPGATNDTPLSSIVTATRTGTATIELGSAPVGATKISLTLTCLTVGSFGYPDGSSMSCDASDLTHAPLYRTSLEVVPLRPGEQTVTITTSANASWTLQAVYVNQVVTPWATNANGETYGVANRTGTPDLVAVAFDGGKRQGYVKSSDINCANGGSEIRSPAQALAWQAASKNRNVSVPVYQSDGTTEIGTFLMGDASGAAAQIIAVASLYPACSESQSVTPSSTGS
jgi:hypothetical protein